VRRGKKKFNLLPSGKDILQKKGENEILLEGKINSLSPRGGRGKPIFLEKEKRALLSPLEKGEGLSLSGGGGRRRPLFSMQEVEGKKEAFRSSRMRKTARGGSRLLKGGGWPKGSGGPFFANEGGSPKEKKRN